MSGKKRENATGGDAKGKGRGAKDPFDAIPAVDPHVEARHSDSSLVQLRREIEPKTRVGRFFAERFGWRRYSRVNLDERGSAFWDEVDGKRDLHAIERRVRERCGVTRQESEQAVMSFTKALMLRGLIGLRLPGQQMPQGEQGDE